MLQLRLLRAAHLPPASGRISSLLDTLAMAPGGQPFVGPDQQALEAMLASFVPSAPAPRVAGETLSTKSSATVDRLAPAGAGQAVR